MFPRFFYQSCAANYRPHKSRRFYQLGQVKLQNSEDNAAAIESNTSTETSPLLIIMDSIPPEAEALSPSDTLNVFRQLRATYAVHSSKANAIKLMNHNRFPILRTAIKASLPYFKMSETKDVLEAIYTMGISSTDELTDAVIESLIENTYIMSVKEIAHLNSFLKSKQSASLDSNKMSKVFQQSLVNQFNTQMSQIPIKLNYFTKIKHTLRFIGNNEKAISKEAFENIAKCAQTEQIDILTANEAFQIIIALSRLSSAAKYFNPLLEKAFQVWLSKSDVTFDMVVVVLSVSRRFKSHENDALLTDNRFIEKCVQVAIATGEEQKMFLILQKLNRLDLSSVHLIDKLSPLLIKRYQSEAFVRDSITICTACDNASYKPAKFDEYLRPSINSIDFRKHIVKHPINWPLFAIRLYRLGLNYRPLVDTILRRKHLFSEYGIAELEQFDFVGNRINNS